MPAFLELAALKLLPENFAIIGFARRPWDDQRFREEMGAAIEGKLGNRPADWDRLASRIFYVRGDFDADVSGPYRELASRIGQLANGSGLPANVLFHLATPPEYYPTIIEKLEAAGLTKDPAGWRRVIVEKPFGTDQGSAGQLQRQLRRAFEEDQVYRIDHFLGKETVQNMVVFRFGNPSFEPIWNRNYIDNIQISVAEDLGIGTRAAFYEATGVVRDMIQNHLLQLLCMVAMEPPVSFDGNSLRNETVEVLRAVREVDPRIDAVRGQYGAGRIQDEEVPGYRQEKGVAPDSGTATFSAFRLFLDNWRWAGVPFYLRSGKRMGYQRAEVNIQFKPTPHLMFPLEGHRPLHNNILTFRLQPEEGIILEFVAKQPGPDICMRPVRMNLLFAEAFGIEKPPSPYAWLLLDAMRGEQTLFARNDWVETAWSIVDPVIGHWESVRAPDFPNYPAGTMGPGAADDLLKKDGRHWL
jgi:glucose-6-phosphate 1-dehydrogenase